MNVGVRRRRAVLLEGDEALVVRDVAELVAGLVLIDERGCQVRDRHLEDVEELRVALVGGEEERLPVLAPLEEIRLRLLARREVALGAIQLAQIEVLVLVPALVVAIKETRVVRKRRRDISAFLGRIGQLLRFSAADRQAVDVEDSTLVAVKEDRLLIGRERAPADACRLHELLDRVLLYRADLPSARGSFDRRLLCDQRFVRSRRVFCSRRAVAALAVGICIAESNRGGDRTIMGGSSRNLMRRRCVQLRQALISLVALNSLSTRARSRYGLRRVMRLRSIRAAETAASPFLCFAISASAQVTTTPKQGLRENDPRVHALTNARIVTAPGKVIEKGTVAHSRRAHRRGRADGENSARSAGVGSHGQDDLPGLHRLLQPPRPAGNAAAGTAAAAMSIPTILTRSRRKSRAKRPKGRTPGIRA